MDARIGSNPRKEGSLLFSRWKGPNVMNCPQVAGCSRTWNLSLADSQSAMAVTGTTLKREPLPHHGYPIHGLTVQKLVAEDKADLHRGATLFSTFSVLGGLLANTSRNIMTTHMLCARSTGLPHMLLPQTSLPFFFFPSGLTEPTKLLCRSPQYRSLWNTDFSLLGHADGQTRCSKSCSLGEAPLIFQATLLGL